MPVEAQLWRDVERLRAQKKRRPKEIVLYTLLGIKLREPYVVWREPQRAR